MARDCPGDCTTTEPCESVCQHTMLPRTGGPSINEFVACTEFHMVLILALVMHTSLAVLKVGMQVGMTKHIRIGF